VKALTFLSVVALCGCASLGKASPSTRGFDIHACDSTRDTLLTFNQSLEGLEGRYHFVIVKRDSVRTPAGVLEGSLHLWRTSPNDSSKKGARPHPQDFRRSYYFGTTNVDLAAADADFTGFWRTVKDPKRDDIDPIHPPILGKVFRNANPPTPWLVFWLAVGSLMNSRDGGGGFDGTGVVFDVKRIDSRGLFGSWDRAGIVRTGHGYFCAYREATPTVAPNPSTSPNTR
jgi:hypothetical protein